MVERVPPQNVEAEVSVLGSMLLENQVVDVVIPMLEDEDFYKTAHKEIYRVIKQLREADEAIDLVILREELKKKGLLENVGGVVYLASLVEAVPSAANAQYYARIVRDKAINRHLIEASSQIMKEAYEDALESDELLDKAEKEIFAIAQKGVSSHPTRLGDILKLTFDQIDNWQDRQGRLTGLETGFYELDDLTCGLQPSELIILAARPSIGKTSFALNISEHVGLVLKEPVALFSLEMSAHQVAQNMLCSNARIDSHRMRSGFLAESEWPKLSYSVGRLSESPIFVDDTPALSALELRAKARRLKLQYDIQLVIVDYLQLMRSPRSESRQVEISEISRSLKALARELEVPVLAVAQLNRQVESREGHKPRMSDLRESGSLEQDADVILLLHRPDYYSDTEEGKKEEGGEAESSAQDGNRGRQKPAEGISEIIVAKQRNGPTGNVNLTFLKKCMRFENLKVVE